MKICFDVGLQQGCHYEGPNCSLTKKVDICEKQTFVYPIYYRKKLNKPHMQNVYICYKLLSLWKEKKLVDFDVFLPLSPALYDGKTDPVVTGVRLAGAAPPVVTHNPRPRQHRWTLLWRHSSGRAATSWSTHLRARRGTLGPRQHRSMHAAARQRPQQQQ